MKKAILFIYDILIPKDSFLRHRLYSKLLWRFFGEPIDVVLDKYFKSGHLDFFIQVGANDGIGFDRMRKFIFKYQLEGLLVEPVDYIFKDLKKNYRSVTNLFFENIAVSDKNEARLFYYIQNKSLNKNQAIYKHYGSFKKDNMFEIVSGKNTIESKIVDCKSINFLMEKYGRTHLSLLMLDTEGYDYEIIKGVDFDRYSIDMIVYEYKNLSPDDQKSCQEYLNKKNYTFVFESVDALAINVSIFDKMN